jgi:hypothetical protein
MNCGLFCRRGGIVKKIEQDDRTQRGTGFSGCHSSTFKDCVGIGSGTGNRKGSQDKESGENGTLLTPPDLVEKVKKLAFSKLWIAIPFVILSVLLYFVPFFQMVKSLLDCFGTK